MRKTVLIVEDSPMMQKVISKAVTLDPSLTVIGCAKDAFEARKMIVEMKPDLITLDLQLPEIDGLTLLESLMTHLPQRVCVISSFTQKGSAAALKALELGALEVIEKPGADIIRDEEKLKNLITLKLVQAAKAQLFKFKSSEVAVSKLTHEYDLNNIIGVASSTGGTEALKVFLRGFGAVSPPILIAQHMPPHFTKIFAENLQKILPLKIYEGYNGQKIEVNSVYLAPGDYHMEIKKVGGLFQLKIHQDPPLHNVRPAADYLLKSIAKYVGSSAIGVILTGMGKDGAAGLLEMKTAGAYTLAQSERTCVVFGMPQAAFQLKATNQLLDIEKMAPFIINHLTKQTH